MVRTHRTRQQRAETMFSFENFPLTLTIALIVMSWLSFLSVIFFGG